MKVFSIMFSPIFYLGWVIQPTLEGFEVYDRLDSRTYRGKLFAALEEAYRHIDDQVFV